MPPVVICDNAKESVLGDFNRKLNKILCHLNQIEPFTPWSNAAERELKKLKKDSGKKLVKSGTPRESL